MAKQIHDEAVTQETAEQESGSAFSIPGLPVDTLDGLPDAEAPLIRNAWYVISHINDVDRTLRSIKVVGEPLVYYRAEDGTPIVLDDRCAHRRFKLSKSKLIGDTIQCGYHGFTYEPSGRCVWAPGVNVKPKFGIRKYPSAEKGPWLWVWMGDPTLADEAAIPLEDYASENLHSFEGYKFNPGNYLLLVENLLDLTHIHFLHGADAAALESANTPPRSIQVKDGIGWEKTIENDVVGAQAHWCGGNPDQRVRSEQVNRQHGPSLSSSRHDRFAYDGDNEPVKPARFRVLHALTPADQKNTHQFYQLLVSEPYVISTEALKHFAEEVVFEQDVEAITYMQEAIDNDMRAAPVEFGILSDRFGISMRRLLRKLKADEMNSDPA